MKLTLPSDFAMSARPRFWPVLWIILLFLPVVSALDYRSGMIALLGGKASITTDTQWRFMEPEAAGVLLDWWGHTEMEQFKTAKLLGLVVPTSLDPTPETGWAVVVLGRQEGWIQADEPQAEELRQLTWMPERLAPQLNVTDHKLLWQSQNNDFPQYIGQILGRDGLLELRSIAPNAAQLPTADEMRALLGQIQFTQGNRYEDYKAGQDKASRLTLVDLVEKTQANVVKTEVPQKPAGPLVWLGVLLGFGALLGLTVLLPRRKEKPAPDELDDLEGVEPDELDPS